MSTFSAAYTQLMSALNRPLSETNVLTAAKFEINNAILMLQRNHAFTYTERLVQVTYPANSISVDLGNICQGPLRDVISVQTVSPDATTGTPLLVKSLSQVINRQMVKNRSTGGLVVDAENMVAVGDDTADRVCFVTAGAIGIYPTPKSDLTLLVHCHIWLPPLVTSYDTNFFLTYAADVVHLMALQKMNIFMRMDSNYQVTAAEVTGALATLITWDGQLKESPNTTIQ